MEVDYTKFTLQEMQAKTFKTMAGESVEILRMDYNPEFPILALITLTSGRKYVTSLNYRLEELKSTGCKVVEIKPSDPSTWEVDAKILVRHGNSRPWLRRHFAKFENNVVWTWPKGRTSYTSPVPAELSDWCCAKLYSERSTGDEIVLLD